MTEAIFEALRTELGEDAALELHADPSRDRDPWFWVNPDRLVEIASSLRDTHGCDYLECVTGVDYPDEGRIHVVYHVYSYMKGHRAVMKVGLDRERPRVRTVSGVWSTAIWQERECFDLLGVLFEGHMDLRRLLLPDDWIGHPLRKDYTERASYRGIPTTRPTPIELFGLSRKPTVEKGR